ncbi:hypothetical protein [Streptomyces sp. NBC_01537]|uniref:hypothetical protein n=1 Tax=Streptomyces sp. NBC_01537 TaxID=2903896 RepID=UPI00387031DC
MTYDYDPMPPLPPEAEAPAEAERTAVLTPVDDFPEQGTAGRAARRKGTQRTGSPIIPPGPQPAALTAVLALLIAGGAAIGRPALAVPLVLLQAVTAAGWFRLNGMWPARQGIALAFMAGVTADAALLAMPDGENGPAVLIGTLGVWLLLVLVLQLRHHGSADERLSSLTATSASTLLTVLAGGFLAAAANPGGGDPVVAGAIAVAVATLARSLQGRGIATLVVALLAATGAGVATAQATELSASSGAFIGFAAGAAALIGLRVASYDFPSRFVHFTAGVALPLTAAAPVVYVLGRVLAG